MIVTEEEAKEMICQETLTLMGGAGDCSIEWHNCQGSKCMAWQWDGWRYIDSHGNERIASRKGVVGDDLSPIRVGSCGKCR